MRLCVQADQDATATFNRTPGHVPITAARHARTAGWRRPGTRVAKATLPRAIVRIVSAACTSDGIDHTRTRPPGTWVPIGVRPGCSSW